MDSTTVILLIALVSLMAFLYSSVGHAGASGYIAVMGLLSLPLLLIKPTSLFLNIIVASVTSVQFLRKKHFSLSLFWPFALSSVPLAFVGGFIKIPTDVIKISLGAFLLVSAFLLVFKYRERDEIKSPNLWLQLACGAIIGLFSGITGTGGGIFLTPLLLFMGWARAKVASGVSALFILVNSISGILGYYTAKDAVEPVWYLAIPVVVFGFFGSYLGSTKFKSKATFILLGIVLVIASIKLIFRL